jgi:hypothetical protein
MIRKEKRREDQRNFRCVPTIFFFFVKWTTKYNGGFQLLYICWSYILPLILRTLLKMFFFFRALYRPVVVDNFTAMSRGSSIYNISQWHTVPIYPVIQLQNIHTWYNSLTGSFQAAYMQLEKTPLNSLHVCKLLQRYGPIIGIISHRYKIDTVHWVCYWWR